MNMKMRIPRLLFAVIALVVYGGLLLTSRQDALRGSPEWVTRRSLTSAEPRTKFNLPKRAEEWCSPPKLPPLDYNDCPDDSIITELRFIGGLTNSLKFTLLGAIQAFEMHRCFVLDENNHLIRRQDKSQALTVFTTRYFEPIGLSPDDPKVRKARREGRIEFRGWQKAWNNNRDRKTAQLLFDVPVLNYTQIEGHELKKNMMRRLWRPLPSVREATCSSLEEHGLQEDFIAFGVRRGDKTLEGFKFTKPDVYIREAQKAVSHHFQGKVPKIFVATDDCQVMREFRRLRPDWAFVSECDGEDNSITGFVLRQMKDWTLDQTDEHYRKFFVELYASAIAKYFIGVTYTNVAWWVYFMRNERWNFRMIDRDEGMLNHIVNGW